MFTTAQLGYSLPYGRAWVCDGWDKEEASLQMSLLEPEQADKLLAELVADHRHLLDDEQLWQIAESGERVDSKHPPLMALVKHVLTPDEDGQFPHPDSQRMLGLMVLQTAFPVVDRAVSRTRVGELSLQHAPKWALRPLFLYAQSGEQAWIDYRDRVGGWSAEELTLIAGTYDELGEYDRRQNRETLGKALAGVAGDMFPLPWVAAVQLGYEIQDGRPFPLYQGFSDERLEADAPMLAGFPWEMAAKAATRLPVDESWFEPIPTDVLARLRAVKRRLPVPADQPVRSDRRDPRDWQH